MKYSHILLTVFVSAVVGFGAAKLASPSGASAMMRQKESTYDRVMRTGTIRCGYGVYAPWIMKDSATGKMSGIVPEIVEEAARNLGLKVEWTEETGWGTMIEALKSNRFDMFCAPTFRIAQRAKFVTFTTPVAFVPDNLYMRKGDTRFHSVEDINKAGVKIAVLDGESSSIGAKMFFPKAQAVSFPQLTGFDQIFLSVATKKADVTISEPGMFNDYNKANPNTLELVPLPHPLRTAAVTFPYRKGDAMFGDMINNAFYEMFDQGAIERILSKYDPDQKLIIRVANPYKG